MSICLLCIEIYEKIQAIQWAKSNVDEEAKDKSELVEVEGKILRQKLGAVFHLIRFGAMSAKEFFEFVGNNKNTIITYYLIFTHFRSNRRV